MLQLATFAFIAIGTTFCQYDLSPGHSAPVGASISIDNPHVSGYSPLLPPSNVLYFPPPEIPHPDPRYIGYLKNKD